MSSSYALGPAPELEMQHQGTPTAAAVSVAGADKGLIIRSVLRHLDLHGVSDAARKESRNREIHFPPISVYRWWARRTGAVNGAILDAFGIDHPGRRVVVDPFGGGGVIPLAAVLRNQIVYAQDLNPWAAEGMRAMFSLPPASSIKKAKEQLQQQCRKTFATAYNTCFSDGAPAQIAHTFRVATTACSKCGARARMFPHSVVTLLQRKERGNPDGFMACPDGHLFLADTNSATKCGVCGLSTRPGDSYTDRRAVSCRACSHTEKLVNRAANGGWEWEVVLVERAGKRRREIAIPTLREVEQAESESWNPILDLGRIPDGQETRVLLRHGFRSWNELYPRRQRAVTETILAAIDHVPADVSTKTVLRMAVYGASEMAGHLSRWDRWYLKSYEAMANHRFNFTTLTVEPNIWGADAAGRGTIQRRLKQSIKAAEWLTTNVRHQVTAEGPLESEDKPSPIPVDIDVRIVRGSSERMLLPDGSADLVLTDPPYHDDVQYGELSLLFRAWAQLPTDNLVGEAVVNDATGHNAGKGAYEELLTNIFSEARRVLRPEGHMIFSYANRKPSAWAQLLSALQKAGFRAVGYAVVHSENETDHAKRGVRACTLDLIMDLVPAGDTPVDLWNSNGDPQTPEEEFLKLIGATFLSVGALSADWEQDFLAHLMNSRFLNSQYPLPSVEPGEE